MFDHSVEHVNIRHLGVRGGGNEMKPVELTNMLSKHAPEFALWFTPQTAPVHEN